MEVWLERRWANVKGMRIWLSLLPEALEPTCASTPTTVSV